MDEETLKKYHKHLRREYRKKTNIYNYYEFVKLFLKWYEKPAENITEDDMLNWKEYVQERFMVNGNIRRITSVNHFLRWLGKQDYTLPIPHAEDSNKIIMSGKEIQQFLESSKGNPLWHLIALFEIDGLLRPGEFSNLKISNMDLENQKYYLDDTKTGNNYIIISPRLAEAIKKYLIYRHTPRTGYEDYLIIIPKGRYRGLSPNDRGEFVRNQTKKIAVTAGITKHVTPYIVKPSVITNDFNNYVNPKIIQRKARHKRVESTLRYDHTDDSNLIRHFEMQQQKIDDLSNQDKARVMFDRFLAGELDLDTFKHGLAYLVDKDNDKFKGWIGYV